MVVFPPSRQPSAVSSTVHEARSMNQHSALQTSTRSPINHRPQHHHLPPSGDGRKTPTQLDFHPFDTETSSVIGRAAQFHDFERQLQENRAKVRAAALKSADLSVNLDDIDDALPLPEVHQRSIHIPTRTRYLQISYHTRLQYPRR